MYIAICIIASYSVAHEHFAVRRNSGSTNHPPSQHYCHLGLQLDLQAINWIARTDCTLLLVKWCLFAQQSPHAFFKAHPLCNDKKRKKTKKKHWQGGTFTSVDHLKTQVSIWLVCVNCYCLPQFLLRYMCFLFSEKGALDSLP